MLRLYFLLQFVARSLVLVNILSTVGGNCIKGLLGMASNKAAIVFIPGFYAKSKDYDLTNLLALGLTTRFEDRQIEMEPEEVKISGQTGRRFIYESASGEPQTLDIFEAYWTDLVDKLSTRSVKDQLFLGMFLFIYWLFSNVLQMARKSRMMLFNFLGVLLLLMLWYYGNVAVAFVTIGQNPNAFGLQLPAEWAQTLVGIGKSLGGWPLWAGTSVLLSLLPKPINTLADMMDFSARYLQDETHEGVGGIRDRIRQRLASTLTDVLKESDYEKVTVLAHSAGVLAGIDLLADYRPKTNKPIRFITIAGMIEFFSYKSKWVVEESGRCLASSAVVRWEDYYSNQDWLCTKTPVPANQDISKFEANRIQFSVPFHKKLLGETHSAYFFERSLLQRLLDW